MPLSKATARRRLRLLWLGSRDSGSPLRVLSADAIRRISLAFVHDYLPALRDMTGAPWGAAAS